MNMRKSIKLFIVMICLLILPISSHSNIYATDSNGNNRTYTITFRPGNVADGFTSSLFDYYRGLAAVTSVEETTHGAIVVRMLAGSELPRFPQANELLWEADNAGLFQLLGFNLTGANTRFLNEPLSRNLNLVAAFARIVDGVEYKVRFIEEGTNTSVWPPVVFKANVGSTATYTAMTTIIAADHRHFELIGASTQELVVNQDASLNIMTFTYRITRGPTRVYQEVINEITGEPEVRYVFEADDEDDSDSDDIGDIADADDMDDVDEADDIDDAEDTDDSNIDDTHPDDQVPSGEEVTLDTGEVPLANYEPNHNMRVLIISLIAISTLTLMIFLFVKRKKKTAKEGNNHE